MSENYLIHFKYKNRYMKNGKYIYVYDDGSTSATDSIPRNVNIIKKSGKNGLFSGRYGGNYTSTNTSYSTTNTSHLMTKVKTTQRKIYSIDSHDVDIKTTKVTEYGKLHVMGKNLKRNVSSFSNNTKILGRKFIEDRRRNKESKASPIGSKLKSKLTNNPTFAYKSYKQNKAKKANANAITAIKKRNLANAKTTGGYRL